MNRANGAIGHAQRKTHPSVNRVASTWKTCPTSGIALVETDKDYVAWEDSEVW